MTQEISTTKTCPRCSKSVQFSGDRCRYCGYELTSTARETEAIRNYFNSVPASNGTSFLGIISVVVGILGLCIGGLPFGILAILLGIPAVSQGSDSGKVGIVLGIVDIATAIVILLFLGGKNIFFR